MNLTQFDAACLAQSRLKRRNRILLFCLAAVMALLFFVGGGTSSREEGRLMDRVSRGHEVLWNWREREGLGLDLTADPYRTGMIGVEWSEMSTTLGLLAAKRTACDARWSVVVGRWFDELGLSEGDEVCVFSSSSFPGMILNVLAAAEARQLRVTVVLSLGSSTWGANVPGAGWLDMASSLRRAGIIQTGVDFCTPGGDDEIGGELPRETLKMMRNTAARHGVPFVELKSLAQVIDWKMDLVRQKKPQVVVSIGGSEANLGDDPSVLKLRPGLHRTPSEFQGTGVIGRCLAQNVPVIHLLEIRRLCAANGIPFDGAPSRILRSNLAVPFAAVGVVLFALAMVLFRRWALWKLDGTEEE